MILAGGTGGHVFPALAVAQVLRRQVPVIWLGTPFGLERKIALEQGLRFVAVTIKGLRGKGLAAKVSGPFKIAVALAQSFVCLMKTRPAAVLGMGGYVSGPAGVAAWLLRIPLVIHEQNAIPGFTNRLLARIAARVLEAFPASFGPPVNAVHTGNPVRKTIADIKKTERNASSADLRILVLGGSQGAKTLNEVVPKAIAKLATASILVRHQCGPRHLESTRQSYENTDLKRVMVVPFIDDMAEAYAWADLVVCRAGALTIAELSVAGKAAILVPYPFAVDDHQTANAHHLVARQAAVLFPETELTPEGLAERLRWLCEDRRRLEQMGQNARVLAVENAADKVALACLEVARGR